MIFSKSSLIKALFSFLLAFLLSQFTVSYVIYPDRPVVQKRFTTALDLASQKTLATIAGAGKAIASLPGRISAGWTGGGSPPAYTNPPAGGIAFIPPPEILPGYSLPAPVERQPTQPVPPTQTPLPTTPASPVPTQPGGGQTQPIPTTKPNLPQPTNTPVPSTPAGGIPPNQTIADLVTLLNNERRNNNLQPVRFDQNLGSATQARADDMHANSYFSHFSPSGQSPATVAHEHGYDWAKGEVIAAGQQTPAQAINGWMNSPGHRAILLDSQAVAVGFGMVNNGCGSNLMYRTCWVGMTGVR